MIRPLRVFNPVLRLLIPLALVSGCMRPEANEATAPQPVPVPYEPNVSLARVPEEAERKIPPVPRRRPAFSVIAEETPDKPKIDWLVGQDFKAVQALLGDPALKEVQAPANVWAYNGSGCVLNIFFYPHVGGSGYQALTYEVKGAEDTADVESRCFHELLEEKNKAKAN